jgi:hypothetical protein
LVGDPHCSESPVPAGATHLITISQSGINTPPLHQKEKKKKKAVRVETAALFFFFFFSNLGSVIRWEDFGPVGDEKGRYMYVLISCFF